MKTVDNDGKIKPTSRKVLSNSKLKSVDKISEFAENIINTIPDLLLILDEDFRVIKASRSFYEFFKVTYNEAIGNLIYDLGSRQWDIPRLKELLETILPEKKNYDNYEVEHDFPVIGKRIILLNARTIDAGAEKEKSILLYINDITEQKNAQKESEEKYLKAFQTSPHGVIITHIENGKFIEVNEAFTSITGFTQEEVLADSSIGLKLWTDPEDRKSIVLALLEGKEVKDKELQFILKNGNLLESMFSAQIIYLKNKPCILSSISDITEHKRIEKKLKESEESFRSLYEDSTIGLYRTTPDGKIILANPILVKMLGYSSFEKLALRNLEEDGFEPAYNRKQFLERIETDGEIKNLESVWTRQDGVTVYISESAKAIRDSSGTTLYYDGTVEDISERKIVEKALRESKNELHVILESTADGILAIDNNGKVIKTNKRFAELWRIPISIYDTKDDTILLNYVLEQLVDPEEFLIKVRLLYKSTDEDNDLLHFKDGRVFERYSMPLLMDDLSVGRVWSFRDITERKRNEKAQEKMLNELNGVNLLLQSLLAPLPFEEKLKKITDSIVLFFNADFCRIWLIRPGDLCEQGCFHAEVSEGPHMCRYRNSCLHLLSSSGRYTHIDGKIHRRVPFGCYKIGRIASEEDHKFITNDAQNDPHVHNHDWARELGLVSFAGYQLRIPASRP